MCVIRAIEPSSMNALLLTARLNNQSIFAYTTNVTRPRKHTHEVCGEAMIEPCDVPPPCVHVCAMVDVVVQ